jgi:hypothetical protein
VQSSVQWPYKLAGFANGVAVPNAGPAITQIGSAFDGQIVSLGDQNNQATFCNNVDVPCLQRFKFVLTPNDGQCSFTSDWSIQWCVAAVATAFRALLTSRRRRGVICQQAFTGACSVPDPSNTIATISLASDNFCPRVIDQLASTAAMGVYDDPSFTSPQLQFVFGTTVYVEMVISSSIVLQASTLVGFRTTGLNNVEVKLVDNKAITSNGVTSNAVVSNSDVTGNANLVRFSFYVSSASFYAPSSDFAAVSEPAAGRLPLSPVC